MLSKIPVTVLIITHRCDDRLHRLLSSLTFANEIMIVDNQSQQDWRLFAHLPLTIFEEKLPITNFSEIKNSYSQLAKNDWILFLDSDEMVDASFAEEIKRLIHKSDISGVYFPRIDYFYHQPLQYGEVKDYQVLRLARKKHVLFLREVHEIAKVSGRTIQAQQPIFHEAHLSIDEFWQKIITYAYLEAQSRFNKAQTFHLWELVTFPIGKFLYNFFWRQGFRDGMRGLIYTLMMSLHSLIVRIRLYELTSTSHVKNF